MKVMKLIPAVLPVLVCVFATPALADYSGGTVEVTRVNGYYGGSGGEFTLYNSSLSTAGYAAVAKNVYGGLNSFQTFCLERSEHIMPPFEANVTVSTTFINEATGVVTGAGSHAVLGSKTHGDNLEYGTAYLYTQFATGKLAGYDYTVPGRDASAVALQQAIWALEAEAIAPASLTGLALQWYNEAVNCKWNSIGNVRVLNVWHIENGVLLRDQDQLWLTPAPGAALLIGIGLSLVGWLKRRIA